MTRIAHTPYPPEIADEARRLKAEGLNGLEISARLGVARSTVYQWLNDPDGDRNRARKVRYHGTCIDCGGETAGRASGTARISVRCAECHARRNAEEAPWKPERIIEAIREWVARYGEPPSASEWNTAVGDPVRFGSGEYPTTTTVLYRFGSWNVAIEAAGFEPRERYSNRGPNAIPQEEWDRTLALWQEHGHTAPVAEAFGVTQGEIRRRLRRLGVLEAPERRAAMPNYNAATAIERDIERTREHIARLEGEIAERQQYLAALEAAKSALTSTNGAAAHA